MPDMKLTSKQKEVVKAMREGVSLQYYWADEDYSLGGFTQPKKTLDKLKDIGIIHRTGGYGWYDTFSLTTLGKTINID